MPGGVVLRGFLHLCPRRPVFTASPPVPWTHPRRTSFPGRALHCGPSLCAGHNKWSKVKHVKGPKDDAKSRMFAKFGLMIRVAVRDGGPNPEYNVNLAHVLEQCRSKNMPKASIEAAIKGAEKVRSGSHFTYEARGPGGFLLLVQIMTDSNTRSHQEIKNTLKKHGGVLCDGARHNFNWKGVVVAHGEGVSSERALELAIEAGAEDVQETEDEDEKPLLQFICDVAVLKQVRAALEGLEVCTLSAGQELVSHTPTLLLPDQLQAAASLLEALNERSDVVRVWDNIQATPPTL